MKMYTVAREVRSDYEGSLMVALHSRNENDGSSTMPSSILKSDFGQMDFRDNLLTIEELCLILNLKKSWIMDHVTRIKPIIPHIRMGKKIRFKRERVMEWLNSQINTKPTWEEFQEINSSSKESTCQRHG